MTSHHTRVDLAGIVVDLMDQDEAVRTILSRATRPSGEDTAPLSVVSANLDHIVQFGRTGRWRRTLGDSLNPTLTDVDGERRRIDWLTLLDGAPLVAQAERLTRRIWPRLAGSDLVGPLLEAAERAGVTVGFLGGSYLVQRLLSRQLVRSRPGLVVAGMWSPDRSDLADEQASLRLAEQIRDAGVDLLVVGLGKPRQELWISRYGPATGASVLLAFGAVVDFLAEAIQRAPRLASDHGLEWAWRLAREPRRLAKRYLLDDPPGLVQLRRDSRMASERTATSEISVAATRLTPVAPPESTHTAGRARPIAGSFTSSLSRPADVAVLVVTYNSAHHIDRFIESLRGEARDLALRLVVVDNDSTDDTVARATAHPDVNVIHSGGNLGYSAGINIAARHAGRARALLVLNPDLEVRPGTVATMLQQVDSGDADLVVPRIEDHSGTVQPSLFREPTVATAIGDALFGARWAQRPGWLAESDAAPESYQFGHEVDWATGAALMIRTSTAERIGPWDERFFLYSEETDYFRRAREAGAVVWFEPRATVMHEGAGSGTHESLAALMAVNRVRYFRKHHDAVSASLFHCGVVLHEIMRAVIAGKRGSLRYLLDEGTWQQLPGPTPTRYPAKVLSDFPCGSVIIPAHNESAVILRSLETLEPVLRTGRVEVIVVCNGCTDDTAAIARTVPGVQVIELDVPSKTAALNAGDDAAMHWPRVYLDADIELNPTTLRLLLEQLSEDSALAGRPPFTYDDEGASGPVRAYYRARRRLPSTQHALWGAGVFVLTEAGHARFGRFPDVTADDYFVDQAFRPEEKTFVAGPPVRVRTPRDVRSLVRVLLRTVSGPAAVREASTGTSGRPGSGPAPDRGPVLPEAPAASGSSTAWELVRSVRGPRSAVDALSYSGLATVPRLTRRRGPSALRRWERDESSRITPTTSGDRDEQPQEA